MKQKFSLSRGFTLVELMIVIAIIGILAAVLYPSLNGYFERSRDTNRQGGLRNAVQAIIAYNVDNNKYPTIASGDNCLEGISGDLTGNAAGVSYIATIPSDPKNGHGIGTCTNATEGKTGYGYKTLATVGETDGTNGNAFVIASTMEIKGNANFSGSTSDYEGYDKLSNFGNLEKGSSGQASAADWVYAVAQ